ncbi:hypothetical protein [Methylomonas koyamae]|uniref:hypothetical protein n=1 Tax=Methylomonas koyamae TaxID=702114 RepID=UPI002873EAB6|nr:hypothetical protein [Methylomonas koyamae]WNB75420.1 hypothetical protein RI210_19400 [Methylomonas koyamae]
MNVSCRVWPICPPAAWLSVLLVLRQILLTIAEFLAYTCAVAPFINRSVPLAKREESIFVPSKTCWPRIVSSRPDAAKVLLGKTAEQVLKTVPLVFTLCGNAQTFMALSAWPGGVGRRNGIWGVRRLADAGCDGKPV